jgi:acetoacetyl-CoA synthetase
MSSNGCSAGSQELWRHSSPQDTQIHAFMKKLTKEYGLSLNNYNDLWNWSVSETAKFWEQLWHYTAIKAHRPYDRVSSPKPLVMVPSHSDGEFPAMAASRRAESF